MKNIVSSERIAVVTVMGLGSICQSMLSPILPLYLTQIGVAPQMLGLMFSMEMVGMLLGEGFWGWVADKVGIKIPLIVGTSVNALVLASLVLTRSVPAIFAVFLMWGLLRSAIWGPGRGYIGATAPLLKKATYMAIIATAMAGTRSLGALPSGFIVDAWGYHWVIIISCGISFLGGIVVATCMRKTRLVKTKRPAPVSPSPANEFPLPSQTSSFRFLVPQYIVTALLFFASGIMLPFLSLFAAQVVGLSVNEVGILFTVRGVCAMVISVPMGILADRMGKKNLMLLGLVISAGSMAATAFSHNFAWLIMATCVNSLGQAMFSPASLGLLSNSVALERQSTAMGFYGAIGEDAGTIAGSALAGFTWSAWGPRPTFLMGTVACGVGAVACLGWIKEKIVNPQPPFPPQRI